MQTDDINIENSLSFSEQQDGLIQGHQMEMQQVLADKQRLRSIIRSQNNVIAQLQEQIAQLRQDNANKDKTIERLNIENKQFRTTPTQTTTINTSQYIETQHIGTQFQINKPKSYRTTRRKLITNDQNQLPLWNNNASSI